ncbi:hypothetical protein MTX78_19750 [Hymenobacter tibetensis]|uniref:Uncharacterized protein n=1 Tax=Hymenobacter tibetensis TaxID=497967 RepID=A0ABY4CZD7_9BACT|nr:hypothetical protein [Hymenobacter tibetensis]UOG74339.1 hypothetical protein MTX78_19750 [Hymenobacter tibetensis]
MSTSLSARTEQTLILFANAFDWHGYAQTRWPTYDISQLHAQLQEWTQQLHAQAKLQLRIEENMALNSYLHRTYHHHGQLPTAEQVEGERMAYLYLHLYRQGIPASYRHTFYAEWEQLIPAAAEAAAVELRLALGTHQAAITALSS